MASKVKTYRPPPRWLLRLVAWPLFLINPPQARGLDKVEAVVNHSSKILLVGNQNLLGLDQFVFITLLYLRHGIFCRRLYDGLFRNVPFASSLLEALGGVLGTRKNAEDLMLDGHPIVFYPGGIAESLSGSPPLLWGDRHGWCILSIKYEYKVVPFASVGLCEALWVLFRLPLQPLLQLLGEARPPFDFPVLAPFNSMERQYFLFGAPIETSQYEGAYENPAYAKEVFTKAHDAVNSLIQDGNHIAAADPERYLTGRVWVAVKRVATWSSQLVFGGGGSSSHVDSRGVAVDSGGGDAAPLTKDQ